MAGENFKIIEKQVVLVVKIIGTIGVTDGHPYQYKVEAWTNANEKHETMVVPTEGDPEFNEELQIEQNIEFPSEFLFFDLFKTNLTGTYHEGRGVTLVPTTKCIDVYTEVDLYGPEKTGFLQLSLSLMDFEILDYASS